MKNLLIISAMAFYFTAYGQEKSDQLKPYLEKIEKEEKEKQIQQMIQQEKALQVIKNGDVKVPSINVKKVSENSEEEGNHKQNKKTKTGKIDSEEEYENEYLNNVDNYRKIQKAKPFIKNGVVYFVYGVGTPLVICSPKFVCDVQFDPGESITNIQIGDATRWIINVKNTDGQTNSHVFLKPIVEKITTNLIISTDKRQYIINLKSDKKKYFNKVAFYYQDKETKLSTVFTDIPSKSKYNYYIRGDKTSWTPVEIRTDGRKTFIQLPEKFFNSPDFPTVYSLDSDGAESQVNKRIYKNWIIIDVMLDRGELKSGVGNAQNKVIFTRKGTFGLISKMFTDN
ncbi:TrbG/VirB9 family P-type conjugative transfer protein [Silvanigrella aquatica]|uniref:P-type conjugative transfer protein TrbG n=1 Tax=Silvanigrella aquatica TaxID=1915309 RepID=A0A1L4D524_9BACT|nr:TrbG/VirB9 family P-type conjugative transfer protein [Silvanigrella aquatica]APJ05287.1 hypothetical protein AXG55_14795 [Silvanigrella aquatica]